MSESFEPAAPTGRSTSRRLARSRTARLVLAGGLLAAVSTGMIAQAEASGNAQPNITVGSEDQNCKATYTLNFSPGLGETAQDQKITGDDTKKPAHKPTDMSVQNGCVRPV